MTDRLEVADTVIHLPGGKRHVVRDRHPIPAELCHLEVDAGGLAVPWVAIEGEDGVAKRTRRALDDGMCGVCGFPREYWMCWHLDVPDAATATRTRNLTGPPMHVGACSAYMHLAYRPPHDTRTWYRYVTRSWKVVRRKDGTIHARLAPAKRVEKLGDTA